VELTEEKLRDLVQERDLAGRAVAVAVAQSHRYVDLLEAHCDVEEAVLLDPLDKVVGVRVVYQVLLVMLIRSFAFEIGNKLKMLSLNGGKMENQS
jgi:hypothetical protein